jgi:hypothetical protein
MPSLFTLEGPNLGATVPTTAPTAPTGGRLALFVLGGAALIGVAALFAKHGASLRGGSMLDTIAAEARGPSEFARRVEAWNASEARPLPVAKLVEAWAKRHPETSRTMVKKLLEEAREQRTEQRERHWSKMSKGLRGEPPKLRKGQRLDYIGQTFVVTNITRGKNPIVYIARPSKDSFGREHLIDARSFPLREFDRQHLKPLDGIRGLRGDSDQRYRVAYSLVTRRDGKIVTVRKIVDAPRALTLAEAEAWRRKWAKNGTAWVETMSGEHVPVKGAKREAGFVDDARPGDVHATLTADYAKPR